jgi:preprotein translocase subunit YajC
MSNMINLIVSFVNSLAFAEEAIATPSFTEMMVRTMPMFFMVFFIFYFLVIRPQTAKERAHKALLATLKRGDTVVTSSGLIGRVVTVENGVVTLESGSSTKLKFEAQHVEKRFEGKVSLESQASNG